MPHAPSVGDSQLSSSNLMSCFFRSIPIAFEASQILIDHVVGRRLQNHLQLLMLVEPVRIFAIAPVGGTAARLNIRDAIRLRPQHAQERFGTHRARPHLHVVRLLDDRAAVGPIALQFENRILKEMSEL